MIALEIIFVLSAIALLVMWGWFTVLAFQTSRTWGLGLIFFFPLSPFMFAYRFERKTRKLVYPFLGSLLFFIALNLFIFFTSNDVFEVAAKQIEQIEIVIPEFTSVVAEPEVKKLNLPEPTPIPEPLTKVAPETEEPIKKPPSFVPKTVRRYKTVDMNGIGNYVGKKVIITTSAVVHYGQMISVSSSEIQIKKNMAGGEIRMGISKSKIQKLEVFL